MRIIIASLLALASNFAWADESYDFYQIRCVSALSFIEIEHESFWNIGSIVWPGQYQWKDHVASLKKLEKDADLYVFDEQYGYVDSPRPKFDCGKFQATIIYKIVRRPKGSVGSDEPLRMFSKVTIVQGNKKIVSELPLYLIEKLKVYHSDEAPNVEICTSHGCEDYQSFEKSGALTEEKLNQLIKP